MPTSRRASADLVAQRTNAAATLLASGLSVARAAAVLSARFQLSSRQSRRYVESAQKLGVVEVPRSKSVFTAKLPTDLIDRLRSHAKAERRTMSSLISEAVENFLGRLAPEPRDGG
jgi:hypothetical protein